jgi:hypothetical protein
MTYVWIMYTRPRGCHWMWCVCISTRLVLAPPDCVAYVVSPLVGQDRGCDGHEGIEAEATLQGRPQRHGTGATHHIMLHEDMWENILRRCADDRYRN